MKRKTVKPQPQTNLSKQARLTVQHANHALLLRICNAVEAIAARTVATTTANDKWEPINDMANMPTDPHWYNYRLNKYEVLDWTRANGGTVWAKDKHTLKYRYLGPFDYETYRHDS